MISTLVTFLRFNSIRYNSKLFKAVVGRNLFMFQFHKVQLKVEAFFVPMRILWQFQFHKVPYGIETLVDSTVWH